MRSRLRANHAACSGAGEASPHRRACTRYSCTTRSRQNHRSASTHAPPNGDSAAYPSSVAASSARRSGRSPYG